MIGKFFIFLVINVVIVVLVKVVKVKWFVVELFYFFKGGVNGDIVGGGLVGLFVFVIDVDIVGLIGVYCSILV